MDRKAILTYVLNPMVSPTDLVELSKALHGELVRPGDGAYDTARKVWNGLIDKRLPPLRLCALLAEWRKCVRKSADCSRKSR